MSTKNLYNEEAQKKVKEMAEGIDVAMMVTSLGQKPLHVVPMSTKKVDELGSIWFLSGKASDHNANIKMDNDVQLIYAKPSDFKFLNLFGQVFITTDKAILKELYQSSDDAWFDGLDDPNLCALEFKPARAHYWDPKSSKFVSLLKMGVAAVTGAKMDFGNEGELDVN